MGNDNDVLVGQDGPVTILTLNDPARRNALSDAIIDGLVDALETADRDSTVSAVVLTGAGAAFCSGGNVRDMLQQSHPMFRGSPAEMQRAYMTHVQRIPRTLHAIDVPVIAAVNGPAVGAGCDIACLCDIRLAAPQARFSESFLRLGLIPGAGGAWVLPRVAGSSRALEMALTCATIDAAEAERTGLVSRVVSQEGLLDEAVALGRRIAAFPPQSIRLTKRLFRHAAQQSLPESLEMAAAFQAVLQHSSDHREALAAMHEERVASFTGD